MGREVRRVPDDWVHPKRKSDDTRFQPMHERSYSQASADWKAGLAKWESGEEPLEASRLKYGCKEYWEYAGAPPEPEYYMPEWTDEHRTHFQMYEDTTEGTPISPVMPDPESLARWLADNNASAFAGQTATYEQWLAVCKGGWAPSMVIQDGIAQSGVAAMGSLRGEELRDA